MSYLANKAVIPRFERAYQKRSYIQLRIDELK